MIPWLLYWAKHWACTAITSVVAIFMFPAVSEHIDWIEAVIGCPDCQIPRSEEHDWAYFAMPVTPTYICAHHARGNTGQSSGGSDMMTGVAVGMMAGSAMGNHHN